MKKWDYMHPTTIYFFEMLKEILVLCMLLDCGTLNLGSRRIPNPECRIELNVEKQTLTIGNRALLDQFRSVFAKSDP